MYFFLIFFCTPVPLPLFPARLFCISGSAKIDIVVVPPCNGGIMEAFLMV